MGSLLSGRRTVVTGAGDIGSAIVSTLTAHGAQVEVWDNSPDALARVAADRVTTRTVDLTDADAVRRAADDAADALGGVDSLVTSAAIARFGMAEDMDLDDWDDTISVNLRGVFLACRSLIPALRANGTGSIVNISSIGGLRGEPEYAAYCSSKFAVIGLTQSLAREVGEFGIRVNAVCPGAVSSEMNTATMARDARRLGVSLDDIEAKIIARTSLRRLVAPTDIADAVVFLISDLASCITAESISVTGGVF